MTKAAGAHLRIETDDGVSVVVGELDQASTPTFDDAIGAMAGPQMVVDLSGLTFVDSMGLRALLRAKQARRGLRFVRPSPTVERIVNTTGVAGVLFADDA
jgi:anti-anti-sigma factor